MIFKSPYPDITIPDIDLATFVLQQIRDYGDKPALVDGLSGRTISYGELSVLIRQAASGLHAMGFKKGDVFAIYSPNLPEYIVAFHAIALVGGIISTINPQYTAEEVHHQLRDSGATYMLTVSALLENTKKAVMDTRVHQILTFDETSEFLTFSALLSTNGSAPAIRINPAEDIVVLPYSSGTTGFPKGVMLTHRNLVANITQIRGIANYQLIEQRDRVIGVLPFFHIYGMVVVMNMSLVVGATIVTMPRFDLVQFLELIQKYHITKINVVPPILVALAKHPLVDQYDLSSLAELFSGAAPLSHELASQVSKRLDGCSVVQGYGLTETSPVTHVYNRSIDKGATLGSVGPAIPNTEIKVVDPESGKLLDTNQRGEIWTRGPQVMKGYLNNPEATAATIDPDGFLHTGDIGYADEKGQFFIVDRLKELIKYKGFQVAPAELEALLLSHPAIADSAVIPVADEEAGQIPKAFIVLKQGQQLSGEEIMSWVAEHISPQKKIRLVEFTEAIPKSLSGKILRRLLVEREHSKLHHPDSSS
jgi:acyl-CoA synthetase (AMP-forming)/AMP-acid ligase II